MTRRLILASTSRYRRELLERLGLPFETMKPEVDEKPAMASGRAPADIAEELATQKALWVARAQPDAYVLGADQLVDLDGQVLGKPGAADACVAQLERLAGRSHRLLTAVTLVSPSGTLEHALDIHTLRMRPLTRPELERYVVSDKPFDCAGGYMIERRGIALFDAIEGDDFTAIVGLPLIRVTTLLRHAGFQVP